jgi:beta-lactamase regulating signal transducer with metallopeptidase domain
MTAPLLHLHQSADSQIFALGFLNLQSFAQLSSARLLNCTAEGIGIALVAWILLRVLGRQNSGTRFVVWFSTLLGIAALPVLGHLGSIIIASLTASSGSPATKSEITMPAAWALYIFGGWLMMSVAGLIRVAAGFWHLRQLRKTCVRIDSASLDPLLRKTLQEFDSRRSVSVCVSDSLRVPTAIGFVRPLVVIPAWAMQELSATELNTILLHELAHLRRWDDWTNLVQKILGALLFFHPAVWWIEKKLTLEREMACDDLVLAATDSPRAYAECLVSLAEKSLLRRGLALAQAAVGRMRHMSLRVAQILDEKRPGATRVWRPAPALLAGISLAVVMIFSSAPRLVSFDNGSADSNSRAPYPVTTMPSNLRQANSISHVELSRGELNIVPAKFVVKPKARIAVHAAPSMVAARLKTKLDKSVIVPAKAKQRRENPPMLVRSSMSEQDAIAPQTLILIMHTGQFDTDGALVWELCVWQVTVMGPAQGQMEPEIIVKSI